MTISTAAGLYKAPAHQRDELKYASLTTGSNTASALVSAATGFAGWANPTTAAVCNLSTAGNILPRAPLFSREWHIDSFFTAQGTGSNSIGCGVGFVMDRLAHMGGLSGTVTTAQTVNVDVTGSSDNLATRRGAANYSDVIWFMHHFSDTGSTAVNWTINYTYNDGTTDSYVYTSLAQRRATVLTPIRPSTDGKYIRSVESITLSSTSGTAGNFGVVAYRLLGIIPFVAEPGLVSGDRCGVIRLPAVCYPDFIFASMVNSTTFRIRASLVEG